MRAPAFWNRPEPTLAARLLAPAGAFYGAVTAHRMAREGLDPGVPVVCIGNLVAGGAGKTPVAISVAERIAARGLRPAVLSRGYGRRTGPSEAVEVDPARHTAIEVGDEPLLLARATPCFVAADRRDGAVAAIARGATALVLDDGMQNPGLAKRASIAVVDGAVGVGNGLCVPAGPLRAPVERQWPFVTLALILGSGKAGDVVSEAAARHGVPVVRGRLAPDAGALATLRGRRLLAFAGIGRPQKFVDTLVNAGLEVVGREDFGDHHAFMTAELERLQAKARGLGADLVTTEKDSVRLPRDFPSHVLPVRLALDDPAPLEAVLDRALSSRA